MIEATESAALVAAQRAKVWIDRVPETARTDDWKEAKILLDLALDARGKDLVVDILHSCATVPCRTPFLSRCDSPHNIRPPKEWCGPCRSRKILGYPPTQ